MNVCRSERFKKAYQKLSHELQKQTKEKLRLFAEDIKHPSLRIKKVQGTDSLWEGSITMGCRFTFEKIENGYWLRNIGDHDKTLKNP